MKIGLYHIQGEAVEGYRGDGKLCPVSNYAIAHVRCRTRVGGVCNVDCTAMISKKWSRTFSVLLLARVRVFSRVAISGLLTGFSRSSISCDCSAGCSSCCL